MDRLVMILETIRIVKDCHINMWIIAVIWHRMHLSTETVRCNGACQRLLEGYRNRKVARKSNTV